MRWVYGGVVFLSAFLLFLVEPMAAKQLLPVLGGSSAVWVTCLVFFQGALLLGYLYAHWLSRQERMRVHWLLLVMAVAALVLPLGMALVAGSVGVGVQVNWPGGDGSSGDDDLRDAGSDDRAAVRDAGGDQSAAAGVVGAARRGRGAVPVVCAVECGVAAGAGGVSAGDGAACDAGGAAGVVGGGVCGVCGGVWAGWRCGRIPLMTVMLP